MSRILRKALIRGLGVAITGGTLIGAPVLAGSESIPQQTAQAEAQQIAQSTDVVVHDADHANGWYLTIGAGASTPTSRSVTVNRQPVFNNPFFERSVGADVNYGGGFSIDAGVGYDFGAIRTELTYGYSRASLNNFEFNNNVVNHSGDASGILNKNDVLASVYYDFNTGSRWVPYIGGGIGYTNISTPSFTVDGTRYSSTNRGLFGWQAKAGIAYTMTYNTDLYAEGVYQGASGFDNNNVEFGAFNSWGGKLGFRYRFGARPAAVVEQPAPQPTPMPYTPAPQPQVEPAPAPIRGLW